MEEQYAIWSILKDEKINSYYFPTPDRIFTKKNLSKSDINDLKKLVKYSWNNYVTMKDKNHFMKRKSKVQLMRIITKNLHGVFF